jgi:hypothetical protein
VLEFVTRWNRLCARHLGEELPLPGSLVLARTSCMNYAQPITVKPRLRTLPIKVWIKDVVVDNHVMNQSPSSLNNALSNLSIKKKKSSSREQIMTGLWNFFIKSCN